MARRIPLYCVSDSYKKHGVVTYVYPPLALGMVAALVRSIPDLQERYTVVPLVIDSEQTLHSSFRKHGPGVYLFSNYLWTVKFNLQLSKLAKDLSRRSITIHGGPSMPKYEDGSRGFFAMNPHVDIGVRGEGENTAVDVLRGIATNWPSFDSSVLSAVAGITFRDTEDPTRTVRNNDRDREKVLERFPSPYLTGVFDHFQNTPESWTMSIVETNRGCPYGCTYCDWGSATLQKIYQFSMDRVSQELEWAGVNKVPLVFIADANFGIFERDVAIAEKIAEIKSRYGYPRELIVNYAKNATRRLADIVRIFSKGQLSASGVISIQTQDEQTLTNVSRSNIQTGRYEELIEIFRNEGLPVSSDLMIGLPGATTATFRDDLQFFIDRQVHTVAFPLMVLPNSPMGDPVYMEKFGIQLDGTGYVVSTKSYSSLDLVQMKMMFALYRGTIGYSVLKYLMYYFQVNNGLKASDIIVELSTHLMSPEHGMPMSFRVFMQHCLAEDGDSLLRMSTSDWEKLYAEILAFIEKRFGLVASSDVETVIAVQIALMPRLGRKVPDKILLKHDFVAYFNQIRWTRNIGTITSADVRPLASFPSSELEISDPEGFCDGSWIPPRDMHQPPKWELTSGLIGRRTIPETADGDSSQLADPATVPARAMAASFTILN